MYLSVAEGFFSFVPLRLLFEAFSHLLDCNTAPKNQEIVLFFLLKKLTQTHTHEIQTKVLLCRCLLHVICTK